MITVTPAIEIDDQEFEFSFIRASGPGGQKVNKTASAVQLRFDALRSPAITPWLLKRLKSEAGRRMTREGVIVISASRYRTQEQNRRDAVERLVGLIRDAARPPKPRRATKPTRAAKERRLDKKRRRSSVKRTRRAVGPDA